MATRASFVVFVTLRPSHAFHLTFQTFYIWNVLRMKWLNRLLGLGPWPATLKFTDCLFPPKGSDVLIVDLPVALMVDGNSSPSSFLHLAQWPCMVLILQALGSSFPVPLAPCGRSQWLCCMSLPLYACFKHIENIDPLTRLMYALGNITEYHNQWCWCMWNVCASLQYFWFRIFGFSFHC